MKTVLPQDTIERTLALAQRHKRTGAIYAAGVLVCFTGAAGGLAGASAGTVNPLWVLFFGFTGAGCAALMCLNLDGWRECVSNVEGMHLAETLRGAVAELKQARCESEPLAPPAPEREPSHQATWAATQDGMR